MSCLRELLHKQMVRIRDSRGYEGMVGMQDELAVDVLTSIGFDRFAEQAGNLAIVPNAPGLLATDNWVWRSLFERTRLLIPFADGSIAHARNPSDRRMVMNELLVPFPGPGDSKNPFMWQDLTRTTYEIMTENLSDNADYLYCPSESQIDALLGLDAAPMLSDDWAEAA